MFACRATNSDYWIGNIRYVLVGMAMLRCLFCYHVYNFPTTKNQTIYMSKEEEIQGQWELFNKRDMEIIFQTAYNQAIDDAVEKIDKILKAVLPESTLFKEKISEQLQSLKK